MKIFLFTVGLLLGGLYPAWGGVQSTADSLPPMTFVNAASVLNGIVHDPALRGDTVSLLYHTLTGLNESECVVDDTGGFRFNLFVGYPTEVRIGFSSVRGERVPVFLMPGEASSVEVENRSHKLYYRYSGAFARVNEEFANRAIHTALFPEIWKLDELTSVKDVVTFRDYLLDRYHKIVNAVAMRQDLSSATKRLVAMQREVELYSLLKDAHYYLAGVGILPKEGGLSTTLPVDYFLPLSDLPSLSDPVFLYCLEYAYLADQIRATLPLFTEDVLLEGMCREGILSEQDYALMLRLNDLSEKISLNRFTKDEQQRLYQSLLLKEEYKKQCEELYWKNLCGEDLRFIKAYWEVLTFAEKIRSFTPLTPKDRKQLMGWNIEYFRDRILELDSTMRVKSECGSGGGDVSVDSSGQTVNADLFFSLHKKHKGNPVVLVFWETWFDPCLSALNALQPLKTQWEAQGVRVVNVASESSPEGDWRQLICEEYPGRHIRVSRAQMRYLRNAYFISTLPAYFLIDREGRILRRVSNVPLRYLEEEVQRLMSQDE